LAQSNLWQTTSGAIDLDMNSVKEELLRKVRMAAKVRVVRTDRGLLSTLQGPMEQDRL